MSFPVSSDSSKNQTDLLNDDPTVKCPLKHSLSFTKVTSVTSSIFNRTNSPMKEEESNAFYLSKGSAFSGIRRKG